jgi:hypothetical protein
MTLVRYLAHSEQDNFETTEDNGVVEANALTNTYMRLVAALTSHLPGQLEILPHCWFFSFCFSITLDAAENEGVCHLPQEANQMRCDAPSLPHVHSHWSPMPWPARWTVDCRHDKDSSPWDAKTRAEDIDQGHRFHLISMVGPW